MEVENTMKTKAIYSDNQQHRFLLDKSWGNGKKIMTIMLYPCAADLTQLDLTTMLCLNNAAKLGFEGISIVNLYSKMNANISHDIAEINAPENDTYIQKLAKECDSIIIAWGHGNNSKKVLKRQKDVLKLLLPYKEKIMTLEDERGITGLHPLTPSLRNYWKLTGFDFPDLKDEPVKDEADSKKKRRKTQKQAEAEKQEETQDTESDTENEEETA